MIRLAVLALIAGLVLQPSASFADDRATCFSLGTEDYKDPAKYDRGLAACTRIINASKEKLVIAAAYRARGSWKEKKNQLEAALQDYNAAIDIEPRNVEGYDYRADVYQRLGEFDKALADYNMATQIDPSYAAAYFSRGMIYEKKGDVEKAKAEYNAALAVPVVNRIAEWAHENARIRLKALAEKKPGN